MLETLQLPADGQPGTKKEASPTSVVGGMASLEEGVGPHESTGSGEGDASPRQSGQALGDEDSGEEASVAGRTPVVSPPPPSPSDATAAAAAAEEGLAQLRALGRQLLQGWAEALSALVKLPGVGSMQVEALAERLSSLAREASPAATAAAAAQAAAADAAPSAAASSGTGGGANAGIGVPSVASRGGMPQAPPPAGPPPSELAGPATRQPQAFSDPVDMFATAAKSAHLSYPELLHAFAASAEGLDDEALADYLFNLAMLCAEPPENELVVRPVLSLPQNSEEQQQYRRRQAVNSSAPVDAMLAAMQQQQAQQGGGGTGGGPGGRTASGGLTHEAIWQQILSQQQQHPHQQVGQHPPHQQYGRLTATRSAAAHMQSPARSKSDMLSSFQAALSDVQMQGLLRGNSATQQQYAAAAAQQPLSYHGSPLAGGIGGPMSPTRALAGVGSPLAKAVSAPERDLWLAAASLANEAEQKQHEAVAAAAAAAAASANFSFHPQPPSPSYGRMGGAPGPAAGSGLWSNSPGAGANTSGLHRAGSSPGAGHFRSLPDFSY